jgi:hypothetical protein
MILGCLLGLIFSSSGWAEESAEDAPAEETKDRVDWSRDLSVSPVFTYGRYRAGDEAYGHVVMGANASLNYRQKKLGPKLKGSTRALAHWQIGSGVRGREIRVGSFIGPWLGPLGLSAGPDIFTSEASYGSLELDPVVGVAVPVILTGDLKLVRAYMGVIPAWYISGDRDGVGEDGFLGMGDEQAFVTGINFQVIVAHMGLSYYLNQDGYGNHHQLGISVGLGM